MLNVGNTVKIKIKTRDISLESATGIKFITLEGKIQSSAKWDKPDTIRLFTGNVNFPVSVIRKANIVEVSGQTTNFEKSNFQTWEVAGSKGNTYTVTKIGNAYKCNCIAGQYNRKCKHVEQISKQES